MIASLFGVFLPVTFLGYFFPAVGMIVWFIVFVIMAWYQSLKDLESKNEPSSLIERFKLFPERAFFIVFPFVLFIGYTVYLISPSYSDLYRSIQRASERQDKEDEKSRLLNQTCEAMPGISKDCP